MATSYGAPPAEIIIGSTEVYSVDFGGGVLDSGELLTGTPTITQESVDPATIGGTATADLTLGSKTVGAGTPTLNGRVAAAGEYLQFTAAVADGANAVGAKYTVKLVCGTSSSPARTLVRRIQIKVIP